MPPPLPRAFRHGNSGDGDAGALTFANDTFDTVNIANSVHCLPDVDAGLRETLRAPEPGGTLAANVPPHRRPTTAARHRRADQRLGAAPRHPQHALHRRRRPCAARRGRLRHRVGARVRQLLRSAGAQARHVFLTPARPAAPSDSPHAVSHRPSQPGRRDGAARASRLLAIAFGAVAMLLATGFIEWNLDYGRESTHPLAAGAHPGHQVEHRDRGTALPASRRQRRRAAADSFRTSRPSALGFAGLASHGELTISFVGTGVDAAAEHDQQRAPPFNAGRDLVRRQRRSGAGARRQPRGQGGRHAETSRTRATARSTPSTLRARSAASPSRSTTSRCGCRSPPRGGCCASTARMCG